VKRARDFGCKTLPLPRSFTFDSDNTFLYPDPVV
jgi:hypothetical protein